MGTILPGYGAPNASASFWWLRLRKTVMNSDSPVSSRLPAPISAPRNPPCCCCEPSPKIVSISMPSSMNAPCPPRPSPSPAPMRGPAPGDTYVQSFARGLQVIRSFSARRRSRPSPSGAARGLTRAGARASCSPWSLGLRALAARRRLAARVAPHPRPRLRVPLVAAAVEPGRAGDGAAGGGPQGVVLGRRARRAGHRLRAARPPRTRS